MDLAGHSLVSLTGYILNSKNGPKPLQVRRDDYLSMNCGYAYPQYLQDNPELYEKTKTQLHQFFRTLFYLRVQDGVESAYGVSTEEGENVVEYFIRSLVAGGAVHGILQRRGALRPS